MTKKRNLDEMQQSDLHRCTHQCAHCEACVRSLPLLPQAFQASMQALYLALGAKPKSRPSPCAHCGSSAGFPWRDRTSTGRV